MIKNKVSFHLSLGSACNLSCKYCFKDLGYKPFSMEEAMKLIDRIFELYSPEEIETINLFSTSEPFFNRERFWTLYDYVVSKGLPGPQISFTTNGTILDLDKDLNRMIDHHYCLVSCDGTKEQHNNNRIGSKDYYDVIKDNVKRMSDVGIKCIASTVVNADDVEIFDTGIALKDMGFDKMSFKVVRKTNFTEQEKIRLLEKVETFCKTIADRIINHNEYYWIYFFELGKRFVWYYNLKVPFHCEKSFPELVVITLDGKVYKCDYDTSHTGEKSVCNIFDENFDKLKFEEEYINKTNSIIPDEECFKSCPAFQICGSKNHFCDKIDADIECEFMKIIAKYLQEIANDLFFKFSDEEINYLITNDRIKQIFESENPKKYLDLDPMYGYAHQTITQIKHTFTLDPKKEIKEIIENEFS